MTPIIGWGPTVHPSSQMIIHDVKERRGPFPAGVREVALVHFALLVGFFHYKNFPI